MGIRGVGGAGDTYRPSDSSEPSGDAPKMRPNFDEYCKKAMEAASNYQAAMKRGDTKAANEFRVQAFRYFNAAQGCVETKDDDTKFQAFSRKFLEALR
jgi:hypothetical protein